MAGAVRRAPLASTESHNPIRLRHTSGDDWRQREQNWSIGRPGHGPEVVSGNAPSRAFRAPCPSVTSRRGHSPWRWPASCGVRATAPRRTLTILSLACGRRTAWPQPLIGRPTWAARPRHGHVRDAKYQLRGIERHAAVGNLAGAVVVAGDGPGGAGGEPGVRVGRVHEGDAVAALVAGGGLVVHLWVPKTIATWADSRGNASARGLRQVPAGRSAPGRACDDLRLVGLKLIFLIVTRAVSLLSLSRREVWWKDAEILILRHQLAVTLREQPRAHARQTWPDRAWLALLARTLPVKRLAGLRLIVAPSSILRWHRDILRRRWARRSRCGHTGRPPTRRSIRSLVLRLARENESWGYRRVHGELAVLGVTVAPSTVWQILKDVGIGPAPRRDGPGWAEFLRSQAQAILALDVFTAGLLNGAKVYVLAVTGHGSRRIQVLGATEHPAQSWVAQQARNLLMDLDDIGIRVRLVLHDRDASFSAAFDAVFQSAGITVIRSAVQAPRTNSIMERWIGSCRRQILDRTLIWNQRHLTIVLREYEDFCNTHRPHRALNQAAPLRPLPGSVTDLDHLRVQRRDRAGGILHEYHLVA